MDRVMVEELIIQFPENGNHIQTLTGRIIPKTKKSQEDDDYFKTHTHITMN